MGEENMWSSKDWTVKVDADAVFLPSRLREEVGTLEVTDGGIYLENCKYVKFGFFGNLEVFSRKAFATLLENIDDCTTSLNYMGSEEDYGKEPWGEDLLAQRCMDLHGVRRVSAWDITTDGMCEAYRPEGEKKNKKWKPDCAVTMTAAMHPFMKTKDFLIASRTLSVEARPLLFFLFSFLFFSFLFFFLTGDATMRAQCQLRQR